jgi:hypothetical protein
VLISAICLPHWVNTIYRIRFDWAQASTMIFCRPHLSGSQSLPKAVDLSNHYTKCSPSGRSNMNIWCGGEHDGRMGEGYIPPSSQFESLPDVNQASVMQRKHRYQCGPTGSRGDPSVQYTCLDPPWVVRFPAKIEQLDLQFALLEALQYRPRGDNCKATDGHTLDSLPLFTVQL